MENIKIHPFVRTLGDGPYKFIGLGVLSFDARSGAAYNGPTVTQHGVGTCAHCSHAILNICVIRNGAGETFGVGNQCVEKLWSEGVVSESLLSEVKKAKLAHDRAIRAAKNQAAREKRRAKRLADMDSARSLIEETDLTHLKSMPHPNEYFAAQGKTYFDYVDYFIARRDFVKAKNLIEKVALNV